MYPAVSHFIQQHTSLKQRVAAAEILQDELEVRCNAHGYNPSDLPLCVDAMENKASIAFGALPESVNHLHCALFRVLSVARERGGGVAADSDFTSYYECGWCRPSMGRPSMDRGPWAAVCWYPMRMNMLTCSQP